MPDAFEQGKSESERGEHLQIHSYTSGNVSFSHEGLWINLAEAGVIPSLENSINQLQELYQKKYVESKPEYTFAEIPGDKWRCDCICGGMDGFGKAGSKTAAKKKAAYVVLVRMLSAAGICKREWRAQMYEMMI